MSIFSNTYQISSIRYFLRSSILVTTLLVSPVLFSSTPALAGAGYALPGGEKIMGGEATFERGEATLDIQQHSERLYIDWHKGFDIGAKASVNFHQPGSQSMVVNRVVGGKNNPTQIMGTLRANGRVIILDENGIIFGKNSRIDVGGLIASTGDINERTFMSGKKDFTLENVEDGKIINKGSISIADSGLAAFVAPYVRNDGMIVAREGTVVMGDAKAVTFDLYGDGLFEVVSDKKPRGSHIENKGKIDTDGGKTLLTALEIDGVVKNLINLKDIRKSDQFQIKNGKIILDKYERKEAAQKKQDERLSRKAELLKRKAERKAKRDAKKNPPAVITPIPEAPEVASLPAPVDSAPVSPVIVIADSVPAPAPVQIVSTNVISSNNNVSLKTIISLPANALQIMNMTAQKNDAAKNNSYVLENYGVKVAAHNAATISPVFLNTVSPYAGDEQE
jgi:filamentous hemagglutinin family protein